MKNQKLLFVILTISLMMGILYERSIHAQGNIELDAPTNLIPSQTPEKQTREPKGTPLRTPRPTVVSPDIPPADPQLARLIISVGILVVVVVIFGVWINRYRL